MEYLSERGGHPVPGQLLSAPDGTKWGMAQDTHPPGPPAARTLPVERGKGERGCRLLPRPGKQGSLACAQALSSRPLPALLPRNTSVPLGLVAQPAHGVCQASNPRIQEGKEVRSRRPWEDMRGTRTPGRKPRFSGSQKRKWESPPLSEV